MLDQRTIARMHLGLVNRRVIAHIGSLGGLYPVDAVVGFYDAAREYDARSFAMVLSKRPGDIAERLATVGYGPEDMLVTAVAPEELPFYLSACNAGLSFKLPGASAAACSPTKVPEYLASGVPVIASRGVGDTDAIIESAGCGVLLDGFTRESYLKALAELDRLLMRHRVSV